MGCNERHLDNLITGSCRVMASLQTEIGGSFWCYLNDENICVPTFSDFPKVLWLCLQRVHIPIAPLEGTLVLWPLMSIFRRTLKYPHGGQNYGLSYVVASLMVLIVL